LVSENASTSEPASPLTIFIAEDGTVLTGPGNNFDVVWLLDQGNLFTTRCLGSRWFRRHHAKLFCRPRTPRPRRRIHRESPFCKLPSNIARVSSPELFDLLICDAQGSFKFSIDIDIPTLAVF
jgi:hypothetical protein